MYDWLEDFPEDLRNVVWDFCGCTSRVMLHRRHYYLKMEFRSISAYLRSFNETFRPSHAAQLTRDGNFRRLIDRLAKANGLPLR